MVEELVARLSGFGPLQPYLDDPEVEEVWVSSETASSSPAATGTSSPNLVLSRA